MSLPWMPLDVPDYLADTAHLNAAQSGAYLHLIMHYWLSGGLPDDDAALARIGRMTTSEWRRAKPIIQAFFHDGWSHKRIDKELAKAADISSKRRASAQQKHSKSSASAPANAEQLDTHARTCAGALPSPEPRKEDAAAPPSNPEKELYDRGKQVLGEKAGGLIKSLLKAKGGEIALAKAAIEVASTKSNPREYIGAIARGPPARDGEFTWPSGIPGVLT